MSDIGLTEANVQQTCTDFLELDGWRSLRTNPVSNRQRGAGFGELGMADNLYIRYACDRATLRELGLVPPKHRANGLVLWIEWKRKGGKARPHQVAWHTLERKRGALTLIAGVDFEASIEGFRAWYAASGLQRRRVVS